MLNTFKQSQSEVMKQKAENDKKLQDLTLNETKNINEIHKNKEKLKVSIAELDKQIDSLSALKTEIIKKIKNEADVYRKTIEESYKRLDTKYKDKLKDLRTNYFNEIKNYKVDFDNLEKDEIGKRELLKSLSDLTEKRKNFKNEEINLIQDLLSKEHKDVLIQQTLIQNSYSLYQKTVGDFKKVQIEKYDLLNKFNSLEKAEKLYKKNKLNLTDKKINTYYQETYELIENQIKPKMKQIVETGTKEALDDAKSTLLKESLLLEENSKFVSELFKVKNREVLFILKYLTMKRKETSCNSKREEYTKIINSNIQRLFYLSKVFKDDFTKNIIENSGLLNKELPNKQSLIKNFDEIKQNIIFNFYFKNDKTIFSFLYSYALSCLYKVFTNSYNPQYNKIAESDSLFVKKIKALNFLKYYIQNESFSEAYSCLQYLDDQSLLIEKIKSDIELLSKNEMVIDLLENHFT